MLCRLRRGCGYKTAKSNKNASTKYCISLYMSKPMHSLMFVLIFSVPFIDHENMFSLLEKENHITIGAYNHRHRHHLFI